MTRCENCEFCRYLYLQLMLSIDDIRCNVLDSDSIVVIFWKNADDARWNVKNDWCFQINLFESVFRKYSNFVCMNLILSTTEKRLWEINSKWFARSNVEIEDQTIECRQKERLLNQFHWRRFESKIYLYEWINTLCKSLRQFNFVIQRDLRCAIRRLRMSMSMNLLMKDFRWNLIR